MRIRKNAKISPLAYATSFLKPGTVIQTHDCQLNQSPWDVMDFSGPPSSPHPTAQVDENNVYVGNVSSFDCIPAVQSEYGIEDNGEYYDKAEPPPRYVEDEPRVIMCAKTDGKSWKCRREAAKGNSLCEHHLSMVRSYSSSSHVIAKRSEKTATESQRRDRPKKARASSSANPYQFYYYSGFGPRWGKKRSTTYTEGNGSDTDKHEDFSESDEDVDYEDGDHEGEEIGEHRKKKARKPIKERSLKSLM